MKRITVMAMLAALALTMTMCVMAQAQTVLINKSSHPPRYSIKKAIFPSALAFAAGASWGLHETATNWPHRLPPSWNQRFWDGRISWENKYARDAGGALIQPLTPRFWGSTTFLAWTTDAKHLFALTHRWSQMGAGVVIGIGERRPWWHYGLDVLISGASYTAGFYISTEAFRLTSRN